MTEGFLILVGYRGDYRPSTPIVRKPAVEQAADLGDGLRACVICSTPFVPKRRLAQTCSRKCKRQHTERIEARIMSAL